jgi:serine/threonine protein kinase
MEYLDGLNLQQLVERYGAQPSDRVVMILVQVCGALAEAHRSGLIHRDIKPANIILCERGGLADFAKVVDFGLVKELDVESGKSTTGILGTPSYIAPEAVTEPNKVGTAVDLYALGAVAYYLLTGKKVFDGKTPIDVCLQHVTGVVVPPSQVTTAEIPAALEELVLQCLSKQPDLRPTATALAKLLRALPRAGNWSEEDAEGWWSKLRGKLHAIDTSTPTMTIKVDIERAAPGLLE